MCRTMTTDVDYHCGFCQGLGTTRLGMISCGCCMVINGVAVEWLGVEKGAE